MAWLSQLNDKDNLGLDSQISYRSLSSRLSNQNGYRELRVQDPGREANSSPPSNADVHNVLSYTYTTS
jgi:hypothetical protein